MKGYLWHNGGLGLRFSLLFGLLMLSGVVSAQAPSGNMCSTKRKVQQDANTGEYLVEITIKKENFSSFAKVEEVLDINATDVMAISTYGSSYTANNGRVRFIWASLPTANEFSVSYKFKCPNTPVFKGVFAFIYNNSKYSYELDTDREIPDAYQYLQAPANATNNSTITLSNTTTSVKSTDTTGKKVCINRTLFKTGSADEYLVKLHIRKDGIRGFAKYIETDSTPFRRVEFVSGALCTVSAADNHEIKIVFSSLPPGDAVEVMFRIISNETPELSNAEFSFITPQEKSAKVNLKEGCISFSAAVEQNQMQNSSAITSVKTRTENENPLMDTTIMLAYVESGFNSGTYKLVLDLKSFFCESYSKITCDVTDAELVASPSSARCVVSTDGTERVKLIWLKFDSADNGKISMELKPRTSLSNVKVKVTLAWAENNMKHTKSVYVRPF